VAETPEQTRGDLLGSDDGDLSRAENRAALSQALQELSERDRAVLELYFRAGWSQKCIGKHFGVSQMQISRWMARAVKQLRTELVGQ
jgi:RNA polymerase sigma-B factor